MEQKVRIMSRPALLIFVLLIIAAPAALSAADKFTTIYSARVMSQSLPWIAQDAALFKKYNIDHNLVFIASSSIVTAALLGGDPDMTLTGGIGNVNRLRPRDPRTWCSSAASKTS